MAKSSNNKAKKVKPASGKTKGEKSAKKKRSNPPTSTMVVEAIQNLQEKKGSSLQAIKKYVSTTYTVDMAKQSSQIKRYIKSAVEKNEIVRTKGNGASGRFRLPTNADLRRKKQKSLPKKPPSQKQAPAKPSAATKKSEARNNHGGRTKITKNSVGNNDGLKIRKSAASRKSKK